jgi:hypothetical protein
MRWINFPLPTGVERFIECLAEDVYKPLPASTRLPLIAPGKPGESYTSGTVVPSDPQEANRPRPYEISDQPVGVERRVSLQDAEHDTTDDDLHTPIDSRCIPAAGQPVNEGFEPLPVLLVQDIVRMATELGQERASAFGPVSKLAIDQPAHGRQQASAMRWIPSKAAHQLKSPDFIRSTAPLLLRSDPMISVRSSHAILPCRVQTAPGAGSIVAPASRHSDMDIAYISALSALAGSVIGGFTSGVTNWLNQHSQARAERLANDFGRREELYRDFILAASKAYGGAIVSSEPQIQELIALYAMISRMRIRSSPQTIACALNVMVVTIATYSSPNKSMAELSELIKSGTDIDPLKEFAEAAREELHKHPARPR